MMELFTRMWVSLSLAFSGFAARVVARPRPVMVTRSRRALTFIEYALLAGIIIVIAALVGTVFRDALVGVWDRITDALNSNSGTG